MANNLNLSIIIGASAGGAMAAFGNLHGVMTRIRNATRNLSNAQRQLGTTIQNAANMPQGELARLNAQYQRQEQLLNRLRASTQALGRSQAAIAANEAGRARLRGQMMESAGLAYLATKPLRVGIEFEASMSKVQALTRLNKDSEALKQLTAQARELGATTSFTASQAAQAQGFLAMAGFNPQQILQSMPAMLDLAKAGDLDLQRTADIASNIQTAYGLAAAEMPRIADTLTKAFTTSNVDLEMLSQTMKYMGPVAKAAGMSLEEASAMAGLLGNAGIQADMAGTALRNTISRLSSPPKAAADALKKLGVSTKDAKGNLKSVPEILLAISKAAEGLGSGERIGIFTDIFGARAAPGLISLLENSEKIKPYIDVVKDSAGTAAKTHKVMADNIKGSLLTLISAWEDLSISLTNTNNGPIRQLLESIASMLRSLSRFTQAHPKLVGWILKAAAALLMFKVALLAARYAALLSALPFLHLVKIFRAFVAMRALGAAGGGMAAVFPRLASAAAWAGTKLKALWTLLAPARTVAAVGIFRGFVAVLRAVAWAFGAILHPLKSIRVAFAALRVALAAGGAAALANPIVLAITAIALAAYVIIRHWDHVKAFFSGFWEGITEMVGPVFSEIGAMLGAIFSDLRSALAEIGAALAPVFAPLAETFAPILEFFREITGSMESTAGAGYALGKIIGGALWLLLIPIRLVIAAIGLIVAAFRWAVSGVLAFLSKLNSALFGIPGQIMAGLMALPGLLVNFAVWAFTKFVEAIQWVLGIASPSRVMMEIGGWLIEGLRVGLVTTMQAVWQWISSLGAAIRNAFLDAPAILRDAGGQIMDGLWQGLKERWENVKALVSAIGEDIKTKIKDALGIASPSRVMMEIGGFAMQGLEMGMAGHQEGPLSTISRLSEGILAALRAPLSNLSNLMAMPPMQPMPALAGAGGGLGLANGNQNSAQSAGLTVNIVVNPAPGMDEKKLAELVTQKLKEAQLNGLARARSRLSDSD